MPCVKQNKQAQVGNINLITLQLLQQVHIFVTEFIITCDFNFFYNFSYKILSPVLYSDLNFFI